LAYQLRTVDQNGRTVVLIVNRAGSGLEEIERNNDQIEKRLINRRLSFPQSTT